VRRGGHRGERVGEGGLSEVDGDWRFAKAVSNTRFTLEKRAIAVKTARLLAALNTSESGRVASSGRFVSAGRSHVRSTGSAIPSCRRAGGVFVRRRWRIFSAASAWASVGLSSVAS
jgi:hypothetical protein